MAYYNSDNLGIGLYDESMSAIVMIPTLDENREFYMSRTKRRWTPWPATPTVPWRRRPPIRM